MVKLKNKIIEVNTTTEQSKKTPIINILIYLVLLLILISIVFLVYNMAKPYINAVKIDKIKGRRIVITECNTRDYLIIEKDKAFSMSLTNEKCEKEYFDGEIIIKNNTIIFNETLTGTIDKDYNIIINNTIFKNNNE